VEFVKAIVFPIIGGVIKEIPQREGEVWEVRGCETGGFRGAPPEVLEDASKAPNPPPIVQHHYKFGFYI